MHHRVRGRGTAAGTGRVAETATTWRPGLRRRRARARVYRHPGRVILGAFLAAILLGTALLSLPAATAGDGRAQFVDALFTATSAITVTGLTAVDTSTYWSPFGQAVILVLIQLGGLGIMTSASLLFLVVAKRIGLRRRLAAQMEVRSPELGALRRLMLIVVTVAFTVEAVVAAVFTLRLWLGYGFGFPQALWRGVFHGVASFNNAGFTLFHNSLERFQSDPIILVPVALAVIIGGLGFPVWTELLRRPGRIAAWSVHTKVTLTATATLLVLGAVAITAFEWTNPGTIGDDGVGTKLLAGAFAGAMPRTAGFTAFDYDAAGNDTELMSMLLMLVGGGSGGTAGGLKVTTVTLLFLIVWAELRGDREVVAFRRRIPRSIHRQALTIATLLFGAIAVGTMLLVMATDLDLDRAMFEVIAASSTAGLSPGTSEALPAAGKAILIPLMLLGRIGPLTVGAALILRERERRFNHPDERIMVV